jgi:HEAT repeat protein
MANLTGKGGFKPGVSANPGGRPKVAAEVRALAQEHSAEAVRILVEIMQNSKAPLASRAAAANNILDRAIGRPEFSGKIETTNQANFNLDRLSDGERLVFEQLCVQAAPLLEKITDDNGGSVN